jgi:hypothetical protein
MCGKSGMIYGTVDVTAPHVREGEEVGDLEAHGAKTSFEVNSSLRLSFAIIQSFVYLHPIYNYHNLLHCSKICSFNNFVTATQKTSIQSMLRNSWAPLLNKPLLMILLPNNNPRLLIHQILLRSVIMP